MRVQRRDDHSQVYEVIEESANYYLVARERTIIAFSKAEYVPLKEWVDVTNECTFHKEHGYIWFSYNDKTCGNPFHPGTRIVVDALGGIRMEALR